MMAPFKDNHFEHSAAFTFIQSGSLFPTPPPRPPVLMDHNVWKNPLTFHEWVFSYILFWRQQELSS